MSELYFIALIPPHPIKETVEEIKLDFSRKFGPAHALKSPPHITLFPPMKLQESELILLKKRLVVFSKNENSFELSAFRFSSFPPRVIFIDFEQSIELETFYQRLMNALEEQPMRTFSPHMTIAFRDMKPSVFHKAWQEYKSKEINFNFLVDQLYVLKHDGKKWQIHKGYPLKGSITNL